MRHPDDRTVGHHGCVLRCRELLGLDEDLVPVRKLGFGVRSRDVPRSTELRLVHPGLRLQRYHIGLGGVQRHGQPGKCVCGHAAGVVNRLVCRSRRLHHLLRAPPRKSLANTAAAAAAASVAFETSSFAPSQPFAAITAAAATRAPTVDISVHLFGHMRSVSAFLWRHILRVERHLRGRWGRLLRCLVQARYRLLGLWPSQHVQAAASSSATAG